MNATRPSCFGEDDCSTMMLASCPFATECSEEANRMWEEHSALLQKRMEIENIKKQLKDTTENQ